MTRGALECSEADIAVSVTGVAGPEPDERGNPVVFTAELGNIGRSRIFEAAAEALRQIALARRTRLRSIASTNP
jgi:nicotinamide mononucleotide (NMN) deamidase PncC